MQSGSVNSNQTTFKFILEKFGTALLYSSFIFLIILCVSCLYSKHCSVVHKTFKGYFYIYIGLSLMLIILSSLHLKFIQNSIFENIMANSPSKDIFDRYNFLIWFLCSIMVFLTCLTFYSRLNDSKSTFKSRNYLTIPIFLNLVGLFINGLSLLNLYKTYPKLSLNQSYSWDGFIANRLEFLLFFISIFVCTFIFRRLHLEMIEFEKQKEIEKSQNSEYEEEIIFELPDEEPSSKTQKNIVPDLYEVEVLVDNDSNTDCYE